MSALERAGLKDFRKCRSYFWLFVLIICCICGVAAFFDFARSRPQIPACVSCIAEEDEDEDAELTPEARKTLDDWFSKHNVKAKK